MPYWHPNKHYKAGGIVTCLIVGLFAAWLTVSHNTFESSMGVLLFVLALLIGLLILIFG